MCAYPQTSQARIPRTAQTVADAARPAILANAALSWWWLDPIAGLGIAGLAVHEGREAWSGKGCVPIEFGSAESRGEEGCC
jgi:hypothetical protein